MAATAQFILDLSKDECDALMDILIPLDGKIKQRVDYVNSQYGLSIPEALEYVVTENPLLWAKVYLDWEARDYQKPILLEGKKSRKIVLRLGRRLGKTDSMCILILWYAYTQSNKGPNNQYDILIMTPYESQIDLIFKRLKQLIAQSPVLQSLLSRDVEHHLSFDVNGITSEILGLTAGANNSSGGANSSRGQRADVIFLDEVDYIGSNQLTNIINIQNEAPERIKIICASTPCGKHEEYYKWCMGASRKYHVKQSDIDAFDFTEYNVIEAKKGEGNGWVEVYAPSIVNRELLKINPDTQQTYLQDIRDELSELRYEQEVMAMFGEEEMGVYQKKYIQMALDEGERLHHNVYITEWPKDKRRAYLESRPSCIRTLGIDWDKYSAGTNMVCIEYDPYHQTENGMLEPCFKVLFRIEIARSEFTYVNAMEKVIELNDEYDFEYIAIDRGYGETQLELFHKYGIENPLSGMAQKVVGYQFKEKIEVTDPYTKKKDSKPMKPFMVNNSVNLFEKGKIILNPKDKILQNQLEEYRVKSISAAGMPIYTDENEHCIDAMNLALLIFEQKHNDLLRKVFTHRIAAIGNLDTRSVEVKSRIVSEDSFKDLASHVSVIPMKRNETMVVNVLGSNSPAAAKRRSAGAFKRRSF